MPNDKRHATRHATVNGGPFEGLRTAAVDGTALAYREQGEGEPGCLRARRLQRSPLALRSAT